MAFPPPASQQPPPRHSPPNLYQDHAEAHLYTTSADAALPGHLAPLLGDRPHLDVLGTTDPWVVPDGWLAETQAKIKALAEDPRSRWGKRLSGSWIDGTEPIIWFACKAS